MAAYGRVQGEKGQFIDGADDEWGVKYPVHSHSSGETLKAKFSRFRRTRYFLFAACSVVAVFIIVVILIAVSAGKRQNGHPVSHTRVFGKWKNKTTGLMFMPEPQDESILIRYVVSKYKDDGWGYYLNYLDFYMHEYNLGQQQSDEFITCNKTNAPSDKICKFDMTKLSPCSHVNEYGYSEGRPCVLLKLFVPQNVTPRAFPIDTPIGKALGRRWSQDHIGVSCDGETPEDRKNIGSQKLLGDPIEYFPKEGFPTYYYRYTNTSQFLAPLVMVRFNTIQDFHYIRIKCTAWGQMFNNGHPESSEVYSTSFVFYLD